MKKYFGLPKKQIGTSETSVQPRIVNTVDMPFSVEEVVWYTLLKKKGSLTFRTVTTTLQCLNKP